MLTQEGKYHDNQPESPYSLHRRQSPMVSMMKPKNNLFSPKYPLEAMAERFGQMVREFHLEPISPYSARFKTNVPKDEEEYARFCDPGDENDTIRTAPLFCESQINSYLKSNIYRNTCGTEKFSANSCDFTLHNANARFYDSLLHSPRLSDPSSENCSSATFQVGSHETEGTLTLLPSHYWIERSNERVSSKKEYRASLTGINTGVFTPSVSDLSSSPNTYSSNESNQFKSEEIPTSEIKQDYFNFRPSCLTWSWADEASTESRFTQVVAQPDINCGSSPTNCSQRDHGFKMVHNVREKLSKELTSNEADDETTKPPFSYITLIVSAMSSKPSKHITLNEIYAWIMSTFAYYRKNTRRWQNSVRHALSFNDCFVKIPRPSGEAGKGCYWTVHPRAVDMFENGSSMRRNRKFVDESRIRAGPNRRRCPNYLKVGTAVGGSYCTIKQEFEAPPAITTMSTSMATTLKTSTMADSFKHPSYWNTTDGCGTKGPSDYVWHTGADRISTIENIHLGNWVTNQRIGSNPSPCQKDWNSHFEQRIRERTQHETNFATSSALLRNGLPIRNEIATGYSTVTQLATRLWPIEDEQSRHSLINHFAHLDSYTQTQ
ncbi:Hepatocyte nuclear factor 3-beta [Fasciola gigantica]|uniref:Hepatocyte nuclear factor 3-beta n=1 Tax=Fasciola gigantica TaxID=46835 RepID=A0A504YXH7_FASGI|nr:Hepatocyte nuclear factor 3-beta [Fasciola gigantica]